MIGEGDLADLAAEVAEIHQHIRAEVAVDQCVLEQLDHDVLRSMIKALRKIARDQHVRIVQLEAECAALDATIGQMGEELYELKGRH